MRQWRLIYASPTNGAENMAVDEALLNSVSRGDSPPVLRFYAWEPACLSLGYGQKATDVDLERLHMHGWDIVRRPTGGRAILHTDELTYSLALPIQHPLAAGGVVESYRRISMALLAGLEQLGAQPAADRRDQPAHTLGPVCFEVPSHYEITINGRKLIGSAQVRRQGGILQHGSLPLSGDIARICDALPFEDHRTREEAKVRVRQRAATLEYALGGYVMSWRQTAEALAEAFAKTFDVVLEEDELTEDELTFAAGQIAAPPRMV